jgi:hypothetical protein
MDTDLLPGEPGSNAPTDLLGIGLGLPEKKLLKTIGIELGMNVRLVDDVRDLLVAMVNMDCGGAVIGDETTSSSAKAFEINVATLKRLRAHPRGRELPVFYLVHWPVREHVMQIAQLGVRDIIGQPANPEYITKRLTEFVESVAGRAATRQAA